MNRAERRRAEKSDVKKKVKTYNFTEEQLRKVIYDGVKKEVDNIKAQAIAEASNTAFFLMLSIPVMVLHDKHWEKTAKRKCPIFIDQCIDLYESFNEGYVTLEELKKCLEEESGIKLERSDNPVKYY